MDGFLAINKPPGISSHDVVQWARRTYKTSKVGHAGTLDPGAAGVLVLGMGRGTKLLSYVQTGFKLYRAELSLGFTTDAMDLFGPITNKAEVPLLTLDQWQALFDTFIGESYQIPPMTSAIKINGQKLYKLARKGQEVERKPRRIFIRSCKVIHYDSIRKTILFDVECSSGTYVRTLCADIALKAGTVGCMSFLLRTAVGSFEIEKSHLMSSTPQELLPLVKAVENWPCQGLTEKAVKDIKNGRPFKPKIKINGDQMALLNSEGLLIALAKRQGNSEQFHPFKVLI